MSDEKYNGWTNQETWAAALHINNNQHTQEYALELAREISGSARANGALTAEQAALYQYESALKDWFESEYEAVLQGEESPVFGLSDARLMVSDVGSLWRVNWREIAANMLEDAKTI